MSVRRFGMARAISGAAALALLAGSICLAEEPKIYKYVDEKGKVIYSNVPPASGVKEQKAVPPPAYKGTGGYSPSYSPYDNPRNYSHDEQLYQYKEAARLRQKQKEEARDKRLAELQDECNRQRRPDCSDPAVLHYIESTRIPRGYR